MSDATENTVQAERARSRIAMAWDSDVAHAFRRSPVAMISAAVTALLILSAVFAPLIAPHDPFNPATLNLMNGFTPPGEANAFTGRASGSAPMTRGGTCFRRSSSGCASRFSWASPPWRWRWC
jgi:ABC-type dipeptide/oligopeptide/nickel transport system permease subunit